MTTTGGNNRPGSFFGIGVGPGDPELLTIKAQRTLQNVGVISFTQLDDFSGAAVSERLAGVEAVFNHSPGVEQAVTSCFRYDLPDEIGS